MAKRTVMNGAAVEEILVDPSKTNEQLERKAVAGAAETFVAAAKAGEDLGGPTVAQAVAAAIDPKYTLKGVKTFQGRDGIGLNATLCRDGKEVAFVLDEGFGGMVDFKWSDRLHGVSAEEDLFNAFIEREKAKIPADKVDELGSNVHKVFDAEYWVNALVDEMENTKRMRRLCKTKTCFQVGDQIGGGEFFVVKGVGLEIRAHIEKKHAGKKIKFLNDEYAK